MERLKSGSSIKVCEELTSAVLSHIHSFKNFKNISPNSISEVPPYFCLTGVLLHIPLQDWFFTYLDKPDSGFLPLVSMVFLGPTRIMHLLWQLDTPVIPGCYNFPTSHLGTDSSEQMSSVKPTATSLNDSELIM